jgi:hypothetical protein
VQDGFDERIRELLADGANLYVAGDFRAAGDVASSVAIWNGSEWSAVGNNGGLGAEFPAYASVVHKGDLYIGGSFRTAGSAVVNGLARWTGKDWAPVGGGVSGSVRSLESDGSDLYVGGVFDYAGDVRSNGIAKWDGAKWTAFGEGSNGVVSAIAIDGSDVYAAGNFSTMGGKPASSIARWNGSEWFPLGGGVSDHALALTLGEDGLYVGGEFYWAGGQSGTDLRHIARWDGSAWHAVGSAWNGFIVYALARVGDDVYAGGGISHIGEDSTAGIAKWNGSSWETVPGDFSNSGTVMSIVSVGSDIYVAGSFDVDEAENGLAKWDGSTWSGFGSGQDGTAFTLEVRNGSVWIGGVFLHAGGKIASAVSKYRFADPLDVCGDFNGDELVTAGDALSVLRAAVGVLECEPVVCDFNGDLKVTALDALATLRAGVGIPVVGKCAESAQP